MSDTNGFSTDSTGASPATRYTIEMAQLTGNAGGQTQALPPVTKMGARERVQIGNFTCASQSSPTIHIARLPIGCALTSIDIIPPATLGIATLQMGNADAPTWYGSAQTFTAGAVKQAYVGGANFGGLIEQGYDQAGPVSYDHEDLLCFVNGSLPSGGNLRFITRYVID